MHFLVSRDGPNAISIEPYRWARLTKFGMDRMRILKDSIEKRIDVGHRRSGRRLKLWRADRLRRAGVGQREIMREE